MVTILVSLVTKPHDETELVGLVYSLTPKISEANVRWWANPVVVGVIVLIGALALNIIFR